MPASAIERASSVCAGESSEHKNSHRPTGSWCRFGIEKAQLCQSYEVCKILVQMRSARLPAFEARVRMRELCSVIRTGRVRTTGDRRRLAPSHSASAAAQREQRRWRSEATPSWLVAHSVVRGGLRPAWVCCTRYSVVCRSGLHPPYTDGSERFGFPNPVGFGRQVARTDRCQRRHLCARQS